MKGRLTSALFFAAMAFVFTSTWWAPIWVTRGASSLFAVVVLVSLRRHRLPDAADSYQKGVRVNCPECGRIVGLTRSGCVFSHLDLTNGGRCPGSQREAA